MRITRLLTLLGLALTPVLVAAVSFPDVPASYPYREAIEQLTSRGVITGNPDGNFRPYEPVDRASMLKMLYKAAGVAPDGTKKNCFPDVQPGSWYETFVCDAVSRGFVQGYDNGKSFKPGRPVSRAEALKLSIAILGLTSADADASLYTDVKTADWFLPFVKTALAHKILPVFGQQGPLLQPNLPLERGGAAAYIWNALTAKVTVQQQPPVTDASSSASSASSSSSSRSSSAMTDRERELAEQRAYEQSSLQEDLLNTKRVSYPFTETITFSDKHPYSLRFVMGGSLTTDISVTLTSGTNKAKVTCRLYKLKDDGLSDEYYIGLQDGTSCYLRSALTPGNYQLEMQPTEANVGAVVTAVSSKSGDGNDGFSESKRLTIGKAVTDFLDSNDLEDWYTFSVTANTSGDPNRPGRSTTVNFVTSTRAQCSIYPMGDVDLFGFNGPVCNAQSIFAPGTYMINLRHALPRPERQAYTLTVK